MNGDGDGDGDGDGEGVGDGDGGGGGDGAGCGGGDSDGDGAGDGDGDGDTRARPTHTALVASAKGRGTHVPSGFFCRELGSQRESAREVHRHKSPHVIINFISYHFYSLYRYKCVYDITGIPAWGRNADFLHFRAPGPVRPSWPTIFFIIVYVLANRRYPPPPAAPAARLVGEAQPF